MRNSRDNAALIIDAGLTKTIREMENMASKNRDAAMNKLYKHVVNLEVDKYITKRSSDS